MSQDHVDIDMAAFNLLINFIFLVDGPAPAMVVHARKAPVKTPSFFHCSSERTQNEKAGSYQK